MTRDRMRTTPTPLSLSAQERVAAQRRVGIRARVLALRTATLSWAVGIFCALVGALMLIVPHQFVSPIFSVIRPYLPVAGSIYLCVGFGLLVVTALSLGRWSTILIHTATSFAIFFYALMLFRAGSWSGCFLYSALALGTLLAGWLSTGYEHRSAEREGDLFAVVLGVSAIGNGLSLILLPSQFQSSLYDFVRPAISSFGLAFVLSGLILIGVQFREPAQRWLFWLAHLPAACTFLAYMFAVALPTRSITGIVFYGGFGLVILTLPWFGQRLVLIDARSLRLRLALWLAAAIVVPLTLMIAFITNQQERIALNEALMNQELLATAQAHEVDANITLYINAVSALATRIDVQNQDVAEQRAQLRLFLRNYPNLLACVTYDSMGRGMTRSDDQPILGAASGGIFDYVQQQRMPGTELRISSATKRPILVIAAPLFNQSAFAGMVGCSLTTERLAVMVDEVSGVNGRSVTIVTKDGRAVVADSKQSTSQLSDLSSEPRIAPFLSRSEESGSMLIGTSTNAQIAGFASMKMSGWKVIVEYPMAQALAAIHQAREILFWLLVLLAAGAIMFGVLLARYLTRPLNTLIYAVDQFAHGEPDAPLPERNVTEVQHLSDSFKSMREQLTEAAEDREEAIKLRDLFFSVAAHELKTPLTSLVGQAELMQRRVQRDNTLPERHQRSLSVIIAQAHRLNRMISSLLDISRLEHGQLSLALAPLDLGKLVKQVVDEVLPTLDHHSILYMSHAETVLVLGDELRLEQVIQNLINNAVKYSPDGGQVEVRLAHDAGMALLSVTDHGIGIPQSALPNLFQRFFRAANAEHGSISGMGIGLYVVKEIVNLHGGTVDVASVVRQGSTFTVRLPLATK